MSTEQPYKSPDGLEPKKSNTQPGQPLNSSLASISMGTGIAAVGSIMMSAFCCMPLALVGVPFAIAAIVTGIQARIKIRDGSASGEGMATAGIICGAVSLALILIAGVVLTLVLIFSLTIGS